MIAGNRAAEEKDMAEPIPSEQAAVDNKEARKAKRAGQTCITFFVVFVISLLSFGKRPIETVSGTSGSGGNLNLISTLGIVMGVFALIFLLAGFKRILRLATTKKVLGLIGCFGLIVHTLLALVSPLSYGAVAPVGTAGFHPIAQSGSEEWVEDGKTYKIASTYFLQLPQGFQFTINYPYPFTQADANMDDNRALAIVFPIIKHAYTSGLYTRYTVAKLGEGPLVPTRIGVVLYEEAGQGARGHRIGLSLDQIKKMIEQESAAQPGKP
jgi:hypothetical protein